MDTGAQGHDRRLTSEGMIMATNQPNTKRDVGGQGDKSKGKEDKSPGKDQPGKASSGGGGSKGKNDSGGNR